MPGQGRKPTVDPSRRLEWLRRVESGEPVTKVATDEKLDTRTIRKHIATARMEQEAAQVRVGVLREKLLEHHDALCAIAAELKNLIANEKKAELFDEEAVALLAGLRQHLRDSTLWRNITQWNQLLKEIDTLKTTLRDILVRDADANVLAIKVKAASSEHFRSVIANFSIAQVNHWARGQKGLNPEGVVRAQPAREGVSTVTVGSGGSVEVESSSIPLIMDYLSESEGKMESLPDFRKLRDFYTKLNTVKQSLTSELTTIVLRQVLPGRCKYCPV